MEGGKMTRAGHEETLAMGLPPRRLEEPTPERMDACAGLRRNADPVRALAIGAGGVLCEIDLVHDAQQRHGARQARKVRALVSIVGRVDLRDVKRRTRGFDRGPGSLDPDALDL